MKADPSFTLEEKTRFWFARIKHTIWKNKLIAEKEKKDELYALIEIIKKINEGAEKYVRLEIPIYLEYIDADGLTHRMEDTIKFAP